MDTSPPSSVAETVWPWKHSVPSRRRPGTLRILLQAALPLSISLYFHLAPPFAHARAASYVIGSMGLTLLLLGLFLPQVFTRVEHALLALVGWIGVALSWIALAPLFYTFFSLSHLFLALRGRDPLQRRPDPTATSYWTPRPPIANPSEHLRRQF